MAYTWDGMKKVEWEEVILKHENGHRTWQSVWIPVSGEFSLPLHLRKHHGVLAQVAYFPGQLVSGLRLYSAGREP